MMFWVGLVLLFAVFLTSFPHFLIMMIRFEAGGQEWIGVGLSIAVDLALWYFSYVEVVFKRWKVDHKNARIASRLMLFPVWLGNWTVMQHNWRPYGWKIFGFDITRIYPLAISSLIPMIVILLARVMAELSFHGKSPNRVPVILHKNRKGRQ